MERLPFETASGNELLASIGALESKMTTEFVSMDTWLRAVVEKKEPWRISPETEFMNNLASLYFAETGDDLVMSGIKEKAAGNWFRYKEREERAYKRLIPQVKEGGFNRDSLNKTDARRLRRIQGILDGNGDIEQVLAEVNSREMKYLERSVNRQRKALSKKSLEGLIASISDSTASIGRTDRSFMDIAMQSVTLVSGDKTIKYNAPLILEEPGYLKEYKEKHPIGVIILPYYVDDDGKYYVYVNPRNEPGAVSHSVLVAGEQTSLTKMTGADILKQPGGPVLAVCAQEMGAINCEAVPELQESMPAINHVIAYPNTNRMGGGFKVYATAKLEKGSSLFERYKGKWYRLNDLMETLEENKNKKPIINELLGVCLMVLQTERVGLLEQKVVELQAELAAK